MARKSPSVQEMVGMFGSMGAQSISRADLKRQTARDKTYSDQTKAQIKHWEKTRELEKVKQQTAAMEQFGKSIKFYFDQKKEQQEFKFGLAKEIIDAEQELRKTRFDSIPDTGGSESEEDTIRAKTHMGMACDVLGIDRATRAQIVGNVRRLSKPKPKEVATIGQKIDFASKHPGAISGDLKGDVEKALGIDITKEMFEKSKNLPYELRTLMSEYLTGYAEGRVNKEDLPKILELTRKGNILELVSNYPLKPKETNLELSTGDFSSLVGPEKILQAGTSSKIEAETAARRLTRKTPAGLVYKSVRDDSAQIPFTPWNLGFEHYKIVEDIPIGLNPVWNDLTEEEKGTARTLTEQGVSSEEIIEAVKK